MSILDMDSEAWSVNDEEEAKFGFDEEFESSNSSRLDNPLHIIVKERTARKNYCCKNCNKVITAGSKYFDQDNFYYKRRTRYCVTCGQNIKVGK